MTNAITAGIPKVPPVARKCQNLQPAIIIMIEQIPIITTDALKCGSNNKSPIMGTR